MNILTIAWKNIKQNLRRPVTVILIIALPLLLMLILGTVFAWQYAAGETDLKADILVYSERRDAMYRAFVAGVGSIEGVSVAEASDSDAAMDRLIDGDVQALVILYETDETAELVLNSNSGITADIVAGLVRDFFDRYRFYRLVVANGGDPASEGIMAEKTNAVRRLTLEGIRRPRAMDYFGILMLGIIILWSSFFGARAVADERSIRTLGRIQLAPVRPLEIFSGLYLGAFVSIIVQIGLVYLLGRYLLGIYFGENLLRPFAILLSECFFALSLGIGISAMVRDDKAVNGMLNLFVHSLVFLGGGYAPLPDNRVFDALSKVSPLHWVTGALFGEIFAGDRSLFLPCILICVAGGVIITGLSGLAMVRRSV